MCVYEYNNVFIIITGREEKDTLQQEKQSVFSQQQRFEFNKRENGLSSFLLPLYFFAFTVAASWIAGTA